MREALTIIADSHINSTLALCKPGLVNDDGNQYVLNSVQRWLWPVWERCLQRIETLTTGYVRNLALNGDIVELDSKDRSWQIISRNPASIQEHAQEIFDPLVQMHDNLFVIRGTEAHSGKSAHAEEEFARDMGAIKCDDTGTYSWWHLRAAFGGVSFDIAHHATMGNLPWTFGNAANKLAITVINEYVEWGEDPPDVAVRAHQHRFADSGRTYSTRGIFCPCWQWHTAYLHRIGKPNARPHIGALVFLCDDGEYSFHDIRFRPSRSKPWKNTQTT